MSTVVVTAAVASNRDTKRHISAPTLLNPYKRWSRKLDETPITEETVFSRSEGANRRPLDVPRLESNKDDAAGDMNCGDDARRSSSPSDGGRDARYRAPGEEALESERNGSGMTPVDEQSHIRQLSPSSEEEGEEDGDQYLLATTSYRSLVLFFTIVPLTALLAVLFLVLLLRLWSRKTWSASFADYLGLSVFAAAAWIVSFSLRMPLYLLSSLLCRLTPAFTPLFSTFVQVSSEEALRLCSLVLVREHLTGTLSPTDPAFPGVWALGIGWAAAEVVVSVWQGYEQLALYKDVLSADDSTGPLHYSLSEPWLSEGEMTHPLEQQFIENPEEFMQEGIDRLVRVRARTELEEVYGVPFPNIPVFISCLQRIDSIILSLALSLLISSSYLSNLQVANSVSTSPSHVSQAIRGTLPTFFIVVVLHTCVAFIWTVNLLPRIGIHSASYIGSVVALGSFFMGLGWWDAL